MCIVSKWARTRNTQYLQFLQASAQSLFAFLIVQYMKVEASGDYYNAWRSEEGAANEKWMIYLQFALWYNTRVWFFLCKKKQPSALTKATIAPITQLSCHQSFNRQTEFKNRKKRVAKQQLQYKRVADEVQVPTFEGDEDAGCGQWLIDHWVPESEGGQCQEGVDRPQTVQLHGGPTSSTTQGVLFKKKKKVSAGTKKKKSREKRRCFVDAVNTTCHNCFGLSIYVTCQISGSQGPPVTASSGDADVEITPQISGSFTELMSVDEEEPSF